MATPTIKVFGPVQDVEHEESDCDSGKVMTGSGADSGSETLIDRESNGHVVYIHDPDSDDSDDDEGYESDGRGGVPPTRPPTPTGDDDDDDDDAETAKKPHGRKWKTLALHGVAVASVVGCASRMLGHLQQDKPTVPTRLAPIPGMDSVHPLCLQYQDAVLVVAGTKEQACTEAEPDNNDNGVKAAPRVVIEISKAEMYEYVKVCGSPSEDWNTLAKGLQVSHLVSGYTRYDEWSRQIEFNRVIADEYLYFDLFEFKWRPVSDKEGEGGTREMWQKAKNLLSRTVGLDVVG